MAAFDLDASDRVSSDDYDSMMGSSDDEDVAQLRDWADIDFWLGQKYFDLILSRLIVRENVSSECASTFSALLHERIHEYPFGQHVKSLQNRLPHRHWYDKRTDYEDLLIVIGRIQRAGTQDERSIVDKSLVNFGGRSTTKSRSGAEWSGANAPQHISPQDDTTAARDSAWSDSLSWESTTTLPVRYPATPEHVIKLKEYGDRVGEAPIYTSRTHVGNPPMTRTELSFRGLAFEVEGRSKKETRQLLAMQACAALGVKVS